MGPPEPVLVGIGCASVWSTIQGRSLLGMTQLLWTSVSFVPWEQQYLAFLGLLICVSNEVRSMKERY